MTPYAFRNPWMRTAAGALDAVGGALFKPPKNGSQRVPQNILIVRLDHLGDVWNMTGLPKAFKEHFSGSRVTCLVSSAAAVLLEANPFVDEIIRYDAPWFWKKRKSVSEGSLIRALKKRQFDAALSLRGDVREHWMLFRAGIPRRAGPGITGGGFLLTHCVPWNEDSHEFDRLSQTAGALGLPQKMRDPELFFADGERDRLTGECEVLGLRAGRTWIAYQVEAGTSAKTWPAGYAARLIKQLHEKRPDLNIALLGGEALAGDHILKDIPVKIQSQVLNLCGRMSLRMLAAAADRFRLVVAPDSGPGHVLAWRGASTLFLYSGTNRYESWKPLPENARALRNPVPCAPCGLRVCRVTGHPCMEGIPPEKVVEAILERLG